MALPGTPGTPGTSGRSKTGFATSERTEDGRT